MRSLNASHSERTCGPGAVRTRVRARGGEFSAGSVGFGGEFNHRENTIFAAGRDENKMFTSVKALKHGTGGGKGAHTTDCVTQGRRCRA